MRVLPAAAGWIGLCVALVATALAQPPGTPADGSPALRGPTRLQGIIKQDARWSGTLMVVGRTQIHTATVTVDPGTQIEFVLGAGEPEPRLDVGTEGDGGRLILKGTAENPIVFRSRNPGRCGSIVAQVAPGNELDWQHVRFEGLGRPRRANALDELPATVRDRLAAPPAMFDASVSILADRSKALVTLDSCTWLKSARLSMRLGDRGMLRKCRFDEGLERTDAEISGTSTAEYRVVANQFAGVVECAGPKLEIADNLLIGPRTALHIDDADDAKITGNYIHNTATNDDGSYCLKCRDADAEVRDNVFRGGTYVVLEGSRKMSGNVLVSAPRLASPINKAARTHYLVAELPGRSVFENNVLIGPAYSLLVTQAARRPGRDARTAERIEDVVIRRNVFDGMGNTGQALRLNVLAREPVSAQITDNVFLRVGTIVMDESRLPGVVAALERNVVAPRPTRGLDGVILPGGDTGTTDLPASNQVVESVVALGMAAPPPAPPDPWDAALRTGSTTVARIREEVTGWYRRGGK